MQNLSTMEKEIFDTVSQKFGRFISDFKITIKPWKLNAQLLRMKSASLFENSPAGIIRT